MRPSGRSRGSVPGRKNVTTLSRIAPLSTRVAGQQCIDRRRQPTVEWFYPAAAASQVCAPAHLAACSRPKKPLVASTAGSEMGRKESAGEAPESAAGNGLLDRRALLAGGASLAGAAGVIA